MFWTLLSILPKTLGPSLLFLRPYLEKQECPPRHAIVYAATHNAAFFTAWNHYTLESCRQASPSPTAIACWGTAVAEVTVAQLDQAMVGRRDAQSEKEGNFLRKILPTLGEGLSFRKIPEMRFACLVVVCLLVSRTELHDNALVSLTDAVVSGRAEKRLSLTELTCLSLIAHSIDGFELPRPLFKAIISHRTPAEVVHSLVKIKGQCDSSSLLLALFKGYWSRVKGSQEVRRFKECLELFQNTIDTNLLTEEQALSAFEVIATPKGSLVSLDSSAVLALQQITDHYNHKQPAKRTLAAALGDSQFTMAPSSPLSQTLMPRDDAGPQEKANTERFLEAGLETLAARAPTGSFLATGDSPVFDHLVRCMTGRTAEIPGPSDFLSVGAFGDPTLPVELLGFTFWLRVSTSRCESAWKVEALKKILIFTSGRTIISLKQIALPYILFSLCDPSSAVRKAASEFLVEMESHVSELKANTEANLECSPHDWKTIYGSTVEKSEAQWLTIKETQTLLSTVALPILEECQQDSSFLSKRLARALSKPREADGEAASLRRSLRSKLFMWLCQVALSSNSYAMTTRLLATLNQVVEANDTSRMQILSPLLARARETSDLSLHRGCSRDGLDVEQFLDEVMRLLGPRRESDLNLLRAMVNGSTDKESISIQKAALRRLTAIWTLLSDSARSSFALGLFSRLATPLSPTMVPDTSVDVGSTLRGLKLSSSILRSILDDLPKLDKAEVAPTAKKSKKNDGRAEEMLEDSAHRDIWTKITSSLELLDAMETGRDVVILPSLFNILEDIQHFRHHGGANDPYTHIQLLDCLRQGVDYAASCPDARIDLQTTHIDLVLDCFRIADGPQARHSALTLLSSLARLAPGIIINSVMPLFTLMGTTIMPLEDANSIYVVEQTIISVIPPLLANLKQQNGEAPNGVAELIAGFVAAVEHVSPKKQTRIFSTFLDTLGADELFRVIVIYVDKHHCDHWIAELLIRLALRQSSSAILKAVIQCLEVVESFVSNIPTGSGLISALHRGTSKFTLAQDTLFTLTRLLKDARVKKKLAIASSKENSGATTLKILYADAARLVARLSHQELSLESLSNVLEDVSASLVFCLPANHSMQGLELLFHDAESSAQRFALGGLQKCLEKAKPGDKLVQDASVSCVRYIAPILGSSPNDAMKLAAIICIDKIAEKFGRARPQAFLYIPKALMDDHCLNKQNPTLCAAALLCLTALVDVLREDFIPYVPENLSKALDLLEGNVHRGSEASGLHNAGFSLFKAFLIDTPWVVSGRYLDRLLRFAQALSAESLHSKPKVGQEDGVLELVAKEVSPVESLAALSRTLDDARKNGISAVKQQLSILRVFIGSHPKSAVAANCHALMGLFLDILDIRRLRYDKPDEYGYSDDSLVELEDQVYALMLNMVYKLNDTVFRPLFVQGCEWVRSGVVARDGIVSLSRTTAWFGFLQHFFGNLKSIVTKYAALIIDSVVDRLQRRSADHAYNWALLISRTLGTLRTSFEHDQDDFWHAHDRFESIHEWLQEEFVSVGGDNNAKLESEWIACMTAFAVASGSQEHRRSINMELLPHLRTAPATYRMTVVRCQISLMKELGEGWLAMLPEMLPFIAEGLEDDHEPYEKLLRQWVQGIEERTGESLQGMLQ